jgi:transposase
MGTHRPVDVLPDREARTLAAWLRGDPEVQTVCRDRAGAYAEGIRTGAPQAIQVADRFHLWKNLCEAAQKTVAAHHHCLRAAAAQAASAERTRTRYAEVQGCLARGLSRAAAARELNPGIQTVRRFANATCAEELPGKAEHRSTKLDPYIDLASQRWNEGVTNAEAITAELRALGFKGDAQTPCAATCSPSGCRAPAPVTRTRAAATRPPPPRPSPSPAPSARHCSPTLIT